MLAILKYIRGYLKIRVRGFSPERFMNLCSNKDILLWDIVREEDGYCMCISLRSFYKLRPIVRKTGTKVVILERCGLPFFVPVMQKRKVFLTGLFLTILFWYLSSLFVWDIELSGNYQVTTDVLETFLKEKGIKPGVRKSALEIGTLERELRVQFPLIIWTSARLDGTKLQIFVKENDAPAAEALEPERETGGTDLVAEYDGTVAAIIVRSGVPKVRIGDVVQKDTLLVDGKVPVYNDDASLREYFYTDADADILLEHEREFEVALPLDYVEKEYTGRVKTQRFIQIGSGWEAKLPVTRPFLSYDRVMKQSRPYLLEKFDIPFFFGSYTYREYQNVEHKYAAEEAERLLKEKLMLFLTTLEEKGVQIIEKDVKIDKSGSFRILRGNFLVRESAGKRVATDRGEEAADE